MQCELLIKITTYVVTSDASLDLDVLVNLYVFVNVCIDDIMILVLQFSNCDDAVAGDRIVAERRLAELCQH